MPCDLLLSIVITGFARLCVSEEPLGHRRVSKWKPHGRQGGCERLGGRPLCFWHVFIAIVFSAMVLALLLSKYLIIRWPLNGFLDEINDFALVC